MKKKEDVWSDLEFLEHVLELAADSYAREKYASYIRHAKLLIINSLLQDVEDGALSARAFKNITGISFREASAKLRLPTKRCAAPNSETVEFTRNAIKTLMSNAKFRQTSQTN